MAIKFIDQEKAYAPIAREMMMGTLGWMGVPKAEVSVVEGRMRTRRAGDVWTGSVRRVQSKC